MNNPPGFAWWRTEGVKMSKRSPWNANTSFYKPAPSTFTFDQLSATYPGVKWTELRTSRHGNRVMRGSDHENQMQDARGDTGNTCFHYLEAVVNPDGFVLSWEIEYVDYYW